MNINQAFPSKYLKAADIPQGRRVTVRIQGIAIEKIGGKDERPVVYFDGKEKGLVLNVTNAKMIAAIAKSDETNDWVGVTISIAPTKVSYQGQLVDSLRVEYPPSTGGGDGRHAMPTPPPPPPIQEDIHPDIDKDDLPF